MAETSPGAASTAALVIATVSLGCIAGSLESLDCAAIAAAAAGPADFGDAFATEPTINWGDAPLSDIAAVTASAASALALVIRRAVSRGNSGGRVPRNSTLY